MECSVTRCWRSPGSPAAALSCFWSERRGSAGGRSTTADSLEANKSTSGTPQILNTASEAGGRFLDRRSAMPLYLPGRYAAEIVTFNCDVSSRSFVVNSSRARERVPPSFLILDFLGCLESPRLVRPACLCPGLQGYSRLDTQEVLYPSFVETLQSNLTLLQKSGGLKTGQMVVQLVVALLGCSRLSKIDDESLRLMLERWLLLERYPSSGYNIYNELICAQLSPYLCMLL
ncbi:hypothetical protein MSG28_014650 [Choristoneura fumiferana]|uniref:Uncharacterized protein n=1 Tax=Choristoneura fumiferana TaxID=7141 RepID=A0ACC0JSE2_CHOFU|nr:hypothetical protein MSG28_014650 [Choristoneura fumiferana]